MPDDDIVSLVIERLSKQDCEKGLFLVGFHSHREKGCLYGINTPKTEGKCDKCGGDLIQRADDNPETIKNRLDVYHEQTEPIKGYYEKLGLLVKAEGKNELEDTTRNVMKALGLEE